MTFLRLYILRWWRQTWDTVVNQSEARVSTEHGIKKYIRILSMKTHMFAHTHVYTRPYIYIYIYSYICQYIFSHRPSHWTAKMNHKVQLLISRLTFHPSIHMHLYPTWWDWQYEDMSDTSSPCVSPLRDNAREPTFNDIILHTFGPRLSRPSLPFSAGYR